MMNCDGGMKNLISQVLEKHLKAGDAGVQAALEEYSSGRLADVHALAYLDAISQHVRSVNLTTIFCNTPQAQHALANSAMAQLCAPPAGSIWSLLPEDDLALCKSVPQMGRLSVLGCMGARAFHETQLGVTLAVHTTMGEFGNAQLCAQMSGNGPRGKMSIHFIVTLCHAFGAGAFQACGLRSIQGQGHQLPRDRVRAVAGLWHHRRSCCRTGWLGYQGAHPALKACGQSSCQQHLDGQGSRSGITIGSTGWHKDPLVKSMGSARDAIHCAQNTGHLRVATCDALSRAWLGLPHQIMRTNNY